MCIGSARDQYYDFKNIFAEQIGDEKRQFFVEYWRKSNKNGYPNIEPRMTCLTNHLEAGVGENFVVVAKGLERLVEQIVATCGNE
jgi:hypothetical protein